MSFFRKKEHHYLHNSKNTQYICRNLKIVDMGILKNLIRQIKSLLKKEGYAIYVAPCGTVAEKLPLILDIEEGKEVAKFNPITGKLYWPSDGSEADGPGIRDIPN